MWLAAILERNGMKMAKWKSYAPVSMPRRRLFDIAAMRGVAMPADRRAPSLPPVAIGVPRNARLEAERKPREIVK